MNTARRGEDAYIRVEKMLIQYRPAHKKLKFRPRLGFLLCANNDHYYFLAIV